MDITTPFHEIIPYSGYNVKGHWQCYHKPSGKIIVLFANVSTICGFLLDGENVGPVVSSTSFVRNFNPPGYFAPCIYNEGTDSVVILTGRQDSGSSFVIAYVEDGELKFSGQTAAFSITDMLPIGGGKFVVNYSANYFKVCQENPDHTITIGSGYARPVIAGNYYLARSVGDKILFIYGSSSTIMDFNCYVGAVSDLSITFSGPYVIEAATKVYGLYIVPTIGDEFFLFNNKSGVGTIRRSGQVDGTLPSFSEPLIMDPSAPIWTASAIYANGFLALTSVDNVDPYDLVSFLYDDFGAVYVGPLEVASVPRNGAYNTFSGSTIVYDSKSDRYVVMGTFFSGTAPTSEFQNALSMAVISDFKQFWTNFSGQSEIL